MAGHEEALQSGPMCGMPRQQVTRSSFWRHAPMVALISALAALTPAILSVAVRGDTGQFRDITRWLGPNLLISVSIGGLSWFTLHRLGRYIATRPSPWRWFALVAMLLAIAATGLLMSFLIL